MIIFAPLVIQIWLAYIFGAWLTSILFRGLFALGVGIITTIGVLEVFDQAKELLENQIAILPIQYVQIVGILQIDTAISIMLSGYVVVAGLKFVGGVAKRIGVRV